MNEKFFLQSRTIIAALLALVVQLGPMIGLSFGEDDASIINDNIDTILTSLFAIYAMYGRVQANSKLVIFQSNRTNQPWIVSVLGVLLLMACFPTTQNTVTPQTPAQAYYLTKASYAVAVEEAAAYAALPFCTEQIVVQCADPLIVIKLDNAVDAASGAFDTADIVFNSATSETTTQADALSAATTTLRTLTAVLALAVVEDAA